MKIGIASDHGGFELKEIISEYFKDSNIEYIDYGSYAGESVDYPEYATKAAEAVIKGDVDKAIVVCGTGIGISMRCNRYKGIRCALCHDAFTARMSREHNDANILALGGRVLGRDLAIDIVKIWLNTEFSGGRHERRIKKIDDEIIL